MQALLDNRDAVLSAFLLIIKLTAVSGLFALVIGTLLAAMRVSPVPVLRVFGTGYVNVFRNTPLTLVIFFCYFGLFTNLGVRISDDLNRNNYWLSVIGLSVYTASFVCEALRAGIQTIPVGQAEAARSIGLTFGQNLRLIILPQALRSVITPLASVLIALTKNATIAGTIGVAETASTMRDLINDNGDQVIAIFLGFALGFLVLTLPTGYFFGWLARKVAVLR
ncbi:MAG TPA: amino acid ABC transporter permease [Mycobacteriales bacterium]|nr:amino acid ABC transporter permease [Mycobacteriales bacterium]